MMIRRWLVLLPVAMVAAALPFSARTQAQTAAAADWPGVATRVESASLDGNVAALREARLACLRLLAAATPDRAPIVRYTVAYADWRLSFLPTVPAREQQDLLDESQKHLEALTAANPRDAEALGLLSTVLGSQIAKKPELGMTLGPASDEMLSRAMGAAPKNPRVLVMRGEGQFHTPPEYGGSIREAEKTFRQALQLFEQEPADKAWPNWGRFDAHAWLGQALADRHDKAGARAEYDAALKIAPASVWVRDVLLPAVK